MSPMVNMMDMDLNLQTMKVKFLEDGKQHSASEEYILVRDINNQRGRYHDSIKGYREQFNIKSAIENGFPK